MSQVCGDIENENDAFEKLEDLTLSQALDSLGMKSILRSTLLFMDRASKTYKGGLNQRHLSAIKTFKVILLLKSSTVSNLWAVF